MSNNLSIKKFSYPENIIFEEIYPNIIVYKNLYSNIRELFDNVLISRENSNGKYVFEKWREWFTFGDYVSVLNEFDDTKETQDRFGESPLAKAEYYCYKNISNASSIAVNHYIDYKNVPLPNDWFITRPNIARYSRIEGLDKDKKYRRGDLAMQFHTDYPITEWYWPGRKFLLTCNTYINDDYSGGEIIFLHEDKIIPYKPSAGEVIVFPSGSPLFPEFPNRKPHYHGVAVVSGNDKYFVRTYVQYEQGITPEWEERKSQFPDEASFDEAMKIEGKKGHNTVAVFMGKPILSPDGRNYIPDSWDKSFNLEDYDSNSSFWVSAPDLIGKLYDVSEKDLYMYR